MKLLTQAQPMQRPLNNFQHIKHIVFTLQRVDGLLRSLSIIKEALIKLIKYGAQIAPPVFCWVDKTLIVQCCLKNAFCAVPLGAVGNIFFKAVAASEKVIFHCVVNLLI